MATFSPISIDCDKRIPMPLHEMSTRLPRSVVRIRSDSRTRETGALAGCLANTLRSVSTISLRISRRRTNSPTESQFQALTQKIAYSFAHLFRPIRITATLGALRRRWSCAEGFGREVPVRNRVALFWPHDWPATAGGKGPNEVALGTALGPSGARSRPRTPFNQRRREGPRTNPADRCDSWPHPARRASPAARRRPAGKLRSALDEPGGPAM